MRAFSVPEWRLPSALGLSSRPGSSPGSSTLSAEADVIAGGADSVTVTTGTSAWGDSRPLLAPGEGDGGGPVGAGGETPMSEDA